MTSLAFTLMWLVFRVPAWPNNFWQWSQVYAFLLLWVIMCLSRFPARPNYFSHSEQFFIFIVKHTGSSAPQRLLTERSKTFPQQHRDLWFGCFAENHFLLKFGGLQTKYKVHSRWWFKHKWHRADWLKLVNFVRTKNPWNRDSGS